MLINESSSLEDVYIIHDERILRKFADPYLCGENLRKILSEISMNLLQNLKLPEEPIVVAIILEGGKYYYIDKNLSRLGYNHNVAEIKIKSRERFIKGDIEARIIEDRGVKNALMRFRNARIIMGETIASGRTMEEFLNYIETIGVDISEIMIFGFHSLKGLERTVKNIKSLGIGYRVYSYGALLGLGENLTDMTLGDEPNEVPHEVYRFVESKLGSVVTKKLCMIGDFTYSVSDRKRYIAERVVQLWEIYKSTRDTKSLILLREGISKLMNLGLDRESIETLLTEEYNKRLMLLGSNKMIKRITIDEILSI